MAPPPPLTFRDLDKFRQDLAQLTYPQAPPTGGLPAPPPKGAQQLQKAERILADELKREAGEYLAKVGENPNAYNEANRLYHSFRQLEQVGGKAVNQSLGNRSVSPSDHALGLASFMGALSTGNVGALGAMGMGAAATAANKLLRERGNSLVADMARRAAETDNVLESAAQALAGKIERAKSPAITFASAAEGGLRQQYERVSERVRELSNPAVAQTHLAEMMPEVAAQYPNVGAAVSQKLLAIFQQLDAARPKPVTDVGQTLTPLAIRERVTVPEMQKFVSTAKGMLEPEAVIAALGRGVVDRVAVEAFKVAHPKMFQQLREKVADNVQERPEAVPFKRRVMLSMVFDFVGDSSLEPARMAGLQQVAQSLSLQEQQESAKMSQPRPSGSGRKSTLASTLASATDSAFGGKR